MTKKGVYPRKPKTRIPDRTTATIERADFRDFVAELFGAAAGMQSLRKAIARRHGLGGTQLAILLSLPHLARRGSVGIKALAAHLHVAGPHITAEVADLMRKDLVHKKVDLRDTRAVSLTVSKKGAALLNELVPVLAAINEELFDLDERDFANIRGFLRHLIEASAHSINRLKN